MFAIHGYLNSVLRVTYCFFYEMLIGLQPTFLGCIAIFVNLIGQLCLGEPSYKSCTLNTECIKVILRSGTIHNNHF